MLQWERPSVTAACLGENEGCWWLGWGVGGGCERVGRRYEKPERMRDVATEEVRRWRRVKEKEGFITAEVWGASDDDG